jgi:hypothetical protein
VLWFFTRSGQITKLLYKLLADNARPRFSCQPIQKAIAQASGLDEFDIAGMYQDRLITEEYAAMLS